MQLAAQKAKGDAKAPAASGTRVIDQVNKSCNVLDLSDLYKPSQTIAREPSLRTATLRRSHEHEHYMRPKPKSAEELRRPLDNQQHRSMGKQRRSADEQHLVFDDGHARSKEEQQWSAENRRKNFDEEFNRSMDNHRRSTEELSSSFEDQRDDAECLDAQQVRGFEALLPPGMLPRVCSLPQPICAAAWHC